MSKANKKITNIIKNNKTKLISLFLTPVILLTASLIYLKTNQPHLKVTQVIDGDTIKLEDGATVRYIGLDSPELAKGKTPAECFAIKAKQLNQDLVLNQKVRLELNTNHMDRFGRTLAYVFLKTDQNEILVNQYLLEQGAGKYFMDTINTKYSKTLTDSANQAHGQKQGLWSDCAEDKDQGCNIKGNLDKLDHRWYHLPSFRHYSQTQVNLDSGDQWFCAEEEARQAGFTKARE